MNIQIFPPQGLSETGKRDHNEDSLFPPLGQASVNDRLFIVCDGVGGASKGEVASRLVAEGLAGYFEKFPQEEISESYLADALKFVEGKMSEHLASHPECRNMATTATVLYFDTRGAIVAWAGDSRIYQYRKGDCLFKSQDHSLVNELVRQGNISEAQARTHPQRNVILRAIKGGEEPSRLDVVRITDIKAGDFFFLCSDGVLEQWEDEDLSRLFASGKLPEAMREAILDRSRGNTKDNFTFYLVQVKSTEVVAETAGKPSGSSSPSKGRMKWILAAIALLVLVLYLFSPKADNQKLVSSLLSEADSLKSAFKYEQALLLYDSVRLLSPAPEEAILKKVGNEKEKIQNLLDTEEEKVQDLVGLSNKILSSNDYVRLLDAESALLSFPKERPNQQIAIKLKEVLQAIKVKEEDLNPKEKVNLIASAIDEKIAAGQCKEAAKYFDMAVTRAKEDEEADKVLALLKQELDDCKE